MSRTKLGRWISRAAVMAACSVAMLATYGLFAGWADYRNPSFDYTVPVGRLAALPAEEATEPLQKENEWTVTRTPQGRPAVFKAFPSGRVFGMFQDTADSRYFTGRIVDTKCTTASQPDFETTFVTMTGGDIPKETRPARPDPWFARLADEQCVRGAPHRIMASDAAMMEWMMHVIPEKKYALRAHSTFESTAEVPAYRLVMGDS